MTSETMSAIFNWTKVHNTIQNEGVFFCFVLLCRLHHIDDIPSGAQADNIDFQKAYAVCN